MAGRHVLCGIIYVLFLAVLNYYLPFSRFYTTFHSYKDLFSLVERANQARVNQSHDYFNNLDAKASQQVYLHRRESGNPLIAIGIISVKRTCESGKHESLGYLYQSAAAMDKMLKQEKMLKNSIGFVCNVDLYPKSHKDAQKISRFLPFFERFGNNSFGAGYEVLLSNSSLSLKTHDEHSTVYVKETFDYVYCLNAATAFKPKYILLVEDDALPHSHFPVVLDHLFRLFINSSTISHFQNVSFFKFYFPSKWQGFSLRFTEIVDLICMSLLPACVYCLFLYIWSRRKSQYSYENLRRKFILAFIISIVSCHIIGRQNIMEFRRLSPHFYRLQSSEACCTQAMLYPANVVPRLSQFMHTFATSARTDLLIRDFAFAAKLSTYQLEPNLFHHTGIHSTLPTQQKHPEEFIFS